MVLKSSLCPHSVQSINYPTVPVGEERLRITPTPGHTAEQMSHLISSINSVFNQLNLKRTSDWEAIGGRAGVGHPFAVKPEPIWNDQQLGLRDGSAPRMLKGGKKIEVEREAEKTAKGRLTEFLDAGVGKMVEQTVAA